MASSRDDFIIAIRSAFLKKSTKQKFSLLTLVFLSIFIITLSNFNFTIIKKIRSSINEIVYRSSFIVSIPENFFKNSYLEIIKYSNFYTEYKNDQIELKKLKSEKISNEIVISENKELKELIEDYTLTTNKILAKVIVDHKSPYLRSIIINKGSTDKIKIGTNIYDRSYLVGRVIEVNYKSSRILLLSDLNSSIPVSIIPGNIQAIIIGNGKNSGEIKYIKDNLIEDIEDKSIAYTSGTGSIFKSGKPVGKIDVVETNFLVNFYSDFSQLKYVFAEVDQENANIKGKQKDIDLSNVTKNTSIKNTEKIKINILNEQIEILNESNSKLNEKNNILNNKKNQLNQEVVDLKLRVETQLNEIEQNNINQGELEFLRLNLIYSSKCQKTTFKKGYKVGTQEYKDCIFRKGKRVDD
ncbi:rod shape-determining protein MreC [Candidatus Pelagibacter sp.]|jgi:rod shape-determining protein MreC|nr:rod shape-determining protein MreC [Candidatus Pelagibacter sp.]